MHTYGHGSSPNSRHRGHPAVVVFSIIGASFPPRFEKHERRASRCRDSCHHLLCGHHDDHLHGSLVTHQRCHAARWHAFPLPVVLLRWPASCILTGFKVPIVSPQFSSVRPDFRFTIRTQEASSTPSCIFGPFSQDTVQQHKKSVCLPFTLAIHAPRR